MCLPFEQIEGFLKYYANLYASEDKYLQFEYWELINEGWSNSGVQRLDNIKMASKAIREAMLYYKRIQYAAQKRKNMKAKIISIDSLSEHELAKKNVIAFNENHQAEIDKKDEIKYLLTDLDYQELKLVRERYYLNMTMGEIAKEQKCTKQAMSDRTMRIMTKLRKKREKIA